MENRKIKSLTNQIQLLMESQEDFPHKLKQRLVLESNKMKHPFKFIVELLKEGVLCDNSSDPEPYFGLNDMVVQLALMVACSKGCDAVGGLMKALAGSGNSELVSVLSTWIMKDFAVEFESGRSEPKGEGAAVWTPEKLAQQGQFFMEIGSMGFRLMEKIIARSHAESELMEQLQVQFVGKSSKIVNVPEFISVLNENGVKVAAGTELPTAISAAFAKGSIGTFVHALERSGNARVLGETYEWLEAFEMKFKNYPVAVRSLTNQHNKATSKVFEGNFFQQTPPIHDLGKVATFKCQQGLLAKNPFALDFNKEKIIAHLADGFGKLWNWQDNEEKTIKFGAHLKEVIWFEYDDEILVLGTAAGSVHLFDARREERWSVRFGEPVHSFRFLESTLVIRTQSSGGVKFWRVEICRSDMRLLNQSTMMSAIDSPGFFIDPDYIFLGATCYGGNTVSIHSTQSGTGIREDKTFWPCYMTSPALMRTLTVVDLISTERIVAVGCECGQILLWNTCKFSNKQDPFKTLLGHKEKIISLCALGGHLLSLDQSGKLLMWSGYDLENRNLTSLAARILAENFYNVTSLVAHERWFASGSSDDGIINIWTLPDLWLRTG